MRETNRWETKTRFKGNLKGPFGGICLTAQKREQTRRGAWELGASCGTPRNFFEEMGFVLDLLLIQVRTLLFPLGAREQET